MDLIETFQTALDSLLANKLRAILTMLGVIIGVAAVIALMAVGKGFSEYISGQIESIGTNLIYVTTEQENSRGYPALSLSDVDALSEPGRASAIAGVSAAVQGNREVLAGGNAEQVTVLGVTANYFELSNLTELSDGDLLTDFDVDTRARVAVLGSQIASDLFGEGYPVGQDVRVDGISYTVIGVLIEQGGDGFSNTDSNMYVPITTAQQRLFSARTRSGDPSVSQIIVQAADAESSDLAQEQIADVLREEHGIIYGNEDDFRLISQADLLSFSTSITGTLTLFLGAIAGISLVVGGIGIMNIMLVSVTERTREIGIRKAVGAQERDILMQFLIESLLLSLIGGIIGILLGALIALVAGQLVSVVPVIDAGTVLLATGFAGAVGLVFGIYPAWRAARLRPIVALRYE